MKLFNALAQRPYLYTGTGGLPQDTIESVRSFMRRDLPFMVELTQEGQQFWAKRLLPWINANVEEVIGRGEDCMGQSYPKPYRPYGCIQKASGASTWFLCFQREKDRAAFVEAFKPYVVNAEPFQTVI